jgi:isoquinoline 1-oxidoreductase subunit beta
MISIDRRNFLKVSATATGGLLLTLYASGCGRNKLRPYFSPNAFLRIDPSGIVTITIPRPEMGQGVRTSLAMLVAEGLDCNWRDVRIEQADFNPNLYGNQYVGGSSSIRDSWEPLRQAGAAARTLLLQAAAAHWKINRELCKTERGSVIHLHDKRRLSYGELVSEAAKLPVPKSVEIESQKPARYIGKPQNSLDVKDIATGRIHFGIDTRVPSMLFASVAHCPAVAGRVKSFDDREARKVKGVRAIVKIDADSLPEFGEDNPKMPSGVAVVADSTWAAMKAREQLRIEWDFGNATEAGTTKMREEAIRHSKLPAKWIYRKDGDPDKSIADAHRVIEAVYEVPLLAHATMEPMNCTADVRTDRAEIWAPTQNPEPARDLIRMMTGLKNDAITIHPVRMGGGFGRRYYNDYVAEAVYISKAIGKPVQTVWTREDDIRHCFFRPAGYHVLRGGLDRSGNPIVWMHHLINASRGHYQKWKPMPGQELKPEEIGPDDFPVSFIPNIKLEYTPMDSPIPRGQWRAVEESSNVFVIQSFLAELADAAGMNEYDFLLRLIGKDRDVPYYGANYQTARLRKVLETAAHFGDWGKPLPKGWGRGIAGSFSNHSYTAQVAEVEVSPNNELRVHRIVAAIDCGKVVNPSGVETQVQGAILFSLSAALMQEITVEQGRVVQSNFDDFPVLRMHQAPKIEVHIIASEAKAKGVGEAAVGQTPPAVTNAIFHATGQRIRSLPLVKHGFQVR